MGQTRQNEFELNWSATQNSNPFNPNPAVNLSGVTTGAMASTNTIYSNVQTVPQMHNIGLEITWTGTPTGTISILVSNSGNNFYALTFNPTLAQPSGSGGGYVIDLNQLPFLYYMIRYVNASGTGSLFAYICQKDLG